MKDKEKKSGCFAINVLQMYYNYECSVAILHGAVGWFSVCDCSMPDHTLLLFYSKYMIIYVNKITLIMRFKTMPKQECQHTYTSRFDTIFLFEISCYRIIFG